MIVQFKRIYVSLLRCNIGHCSKGKRDYLDIAYSYSRAYFISTLEISILVVIYMLLLIAKNKSV